MWNNMENEYHQQMTIFYCIWLLKNLLIHIFIFELYQKFVFRQNDITVYGLY